MNKELILQTLDVFWKGMLSIFIAIGIIYLSILVLNYITSRKKENK